MREIKKWHLQRLSFSACSISPCPDQPCSWGLLTSPAVISAHSYRDLVNQAISCCSCISVSLDMDFLPFHRHWHVILVWIQWIWTIISRRQEQQCRTVFSLHAVTSVGYNKHNCLWVLCLPNPHPGFAQDLLWLLWRESLLFCKDTQKAAAQMGPALGHGDWFWRLPVPLLVAAKLRPQGTPAARHLHSWGLCLSVDTST